MVTLRQFMFRNIVFYMITFNDSYIIKSQIRHRLLIQIKSVQFIFQQFQVMGVLPLKYREQYEIIQRFQHQISEYYDSNSELSKKIVRVQSQSQRCTGILVAPNLILSVIHGIKPGQRIVAHCNGKEYECDIINQRTHRHIYTQYHRHRQLSKEYQATQDNTPYLKQLYKLQQAKKLDWVILKLKQNVSSNFHPINFATYSNDLTTKIFMLCFERTTSGGYTGKIQKRYCSQYLRQSLPATRRILNHGIYTLNGDSGCGIFIQVGNNIHLVGLHVGLFHSQPVALLFDAQMIKEISIQMQMMKNSVQPGDQNQRKRTKQNRYCPTPDRSSNKKICTNSRQAKDNIHPNQDPLFNRLVKNLGPSSFIDFPKFDTEKLTLKLFLAKNQKLKLGIFYENQRYRFDIEQPISSDSQNYKLVICKIEQKDQQYVLIHLNDAEFKVECRIKDLQFQLIKIDGKYSDHSFIQARKQ